MHSVVGQKPFITLKVGIFKRAEKHLNKKSRWAQFIGTAARKNDCK